MLNWPIRDESRNDNAHIIMRWAEVLLNKAEALAELGEMNDAFEVSKEKPYGPVGTFNSFDWHAPLKNRIDYIFVSDAIEVLKYAVLVDALDMRYPSDHMPVVAHVRLGNNQ